MTPARPAAVRDASSVARSKSDLDMKTPRIEWEGRGLGGKEVGRAAPFGIGKPPCDVNWRVTIRCKVPHGWPQAMSRTPQPSPRTGGKNSFTCRFLTSRSDVILNP